MKVSVTDPRNLVGKELQGKLSPVLDVALGLQYCWATTRLMRAAVEMSAIRQAANLCVVLVACFLIFGAVTPTSDQRRAAIVIGNAAYNTAPLKNTDDDAVLVASVLVELDFDVLLYLDTKKSERISLEQTVRNHLVGADIAVFYYAGHAVQHEGQNLLLPVDTRTGAATEILEDAIALNQILDIVKDDPVGIKLVILDACRDSPAKQAGLQQGLAYTEAGASQVLIGFATSAGKVAYDGTGANSPYSSALANALQQPGLDIYDIFRQIRGNVRIATDGAQIPWVTGSVESEVILRPSSRVRPIEVESASSDGITTGLDVILWHFIQDSRDPEDFLRFKQLFPSSSFVAKATQSEDATIAARLSRKVYVDGVPVSKPDTSSIQSNEDQIVFAQSGERAAIQELRRWPRTLPQTKDGLSQLVTNCDVEAGDPADPQRVVPGVGNEGINLRIALRNCVSALAADEDNPRLQFQLGRVLEVSQKYDWAAEYYQLAARSQYSAALTNLGHMHRLGLGRPVDYVKALDFFRQAAALGNLRARVNVGAAYVRGQGVPAMPEEGVLWYQLAASAGWPQAFNSLADSYRRGMGVARNYKTAAVLYSVAAEGGHLDAMSSLGRAYVSGEGVEKDVRRGLNLMLRAAEMGNKYAPYFAGRLLRDGAAGIKRNRQQALNLFKLSAERGFEMAYLDLADGYRTGVLNNGTPDSRRGYYYVLIAVRFGAPESERTKRLIERSLDGPTRKTVESEAERFIEQNGL
jgi:uncharacterized protein